MLGLLYKDFYLVRRNIWIGFLLIAGGVLFAIIFILGMNIGNFQELKEIGDIYNVFFKSTIVSVCMGGIAIALSSFSAIEQDHKAEWYKVLYASPINIWQEIGSRYILAFAINTIMCAWSAVLLPLVYLAGDTGFGLAECKIIGYCWLLGILGILIRLPVDILFSTKVSVTISCSFIFVLLCALMVWINSEPEITAVFKTIMSWIDFVYDHGAWIVGGITITSFGVSYFGKRNRRWA